VEGGGQMGTQDDRLREALAAMDPSRRLRAALDAGTRGHGGAEEPQPRAAGSGGCRRGRARPCGRVTARCGPGPRPGDSAAGRRPGRGLRGCPRGGEARARAGAAGRGELTLDLVACAGDEVAQVLDGCADKVPDSLRCEYTPENTEISGVQSHLSDVRDTVPMRIGEVSQCSGVSVRML